MRLPGALNETSGAAFSLLDPTNIWSHNDSGNRAELFAIDLQGKVHARIRVDARNRDWEALDRGACPGGSCLYIADSGDNELVRGQIDLYRLIEPELTEKDKVEAERFRMRLPDGPRNIEAMFVLPGEQIYLVTKGRHHPVSVYHYPGPLESDSVVTLVEIQKLTEGTQSLAGMVTGASASEDGSLVAIRRYASLEFFTFAEGRLQPLDGGALSLFTLREPQGEAVALGPGGQVALTSERDGSTRSVMHLLRCELQTG
ncbi:MAG: hypothetical protein V3T24_07630 [Longimicrobiales bacterium]